MAVVGSVLSSNFSVNTGATSEFIFKQYHTDVLFVLVIVILLL